MERWRSALRRLPTVWKLALFSAVAWLPVSTMIILATSAEGEPLPTPLRALRLVMTLVAYGVIIAVFMKVARLRD
jgi:hypothetical protein